MSKSHPTNVRRRILYLGSVLVLTLCIWGHVSELFDHWDNTFRTGNDIEYSTVIVVLLAGAVICFALFVVIVTGSRTTIAPPVRRLPAWAAAVPPIASFTAHSPPAPLRI